MILKGHRIHGDTRIYSIALLPWIADIFLSAVVKNEKRIFASK